MTDLLEKAIATARCFHWKCRTRSRAVLALTGDDERPVYQPTPEEEADLDESDAEAARGAFATDEEVRAVWAKHRL